MVINSIVDDYSLVIGIVSGVSKATGNKYCILHLLENFSYGDSKIGFATSQKSISFDLINQYQITVGDQIQFLYVGSGDYKKLKHIDVIPFEDKKK